MFYRWESQWQWHIKWRNLGTIIIVIEKNKHEWIKEASMRQLK
jgi:hypothetical protein